MSPIHPLAEKELICNCTFHTLSQQDNPSSDFAKVPSLRESGRRQATDGFLCSHSESTLGVY
jgi:hypothetical protein